MRLCTRAHVNVRLAERAYLGGVPYDEIGRGQRCI